MMKCRPGIGDEFLKSHTQDQAPICISSAYLCAFFQGVSKMSFSNPNFNLKQDYGRREVGEGVKRRK